MCRVANVIIFCDVQRLWIVPVWTYSDNRDL